MKKYIAYQVGVDMFDTLKTLELQRDMITNIDGFSSIYEANEFLKNKTAQFVIFDSESKKIVALN